MFTRPRSLVRRRNNVTLEKFYNNKIGNSKIKLRFSKIKVGNSNFKVDYLGLLRHSGVLLLLVFVRRGAVCVVRRVLTIEQFLSPSS